MHSRIFEISSEPVEPRDRITELSIPEWFCHSVADYTSDDTDRSHDLDWFKQNMVGIINVSDDGESFSFLPDGKLKYFRRSYSAFLEQARNLTGISLEAFAGETQYDIGMAMYRLNSAYNDKYEFYVYMNDELKTLDDWIRESDLSGSFYFGGTVDYHF